MFGVCRFPGRTAISREVRGHVGGCVQCVVAYLSKRGVSVATRFVWCKGGEAGVCDWAASFSGIVL